MCSPTKARLLKLALALADADSSVLDQVEALLCGGKTNWQHLLDACHLREVCAVFNQERFPLVNSYTADGVKEVMFTGKCDKSGQIILDKALLHSKPVDAGSAMLYIASGKTKGDKLVITGCTWSGEEDGHNYVVIYDKAASAIHPELVDDLDCSYTFLAC